MAKKASLKETITGMVKGKPKAKVESLTAPPPANPQAPDAFAVMCEGFKANDIFGKLETTVIHNLTLTKTTAAGTKHFTTKYEGQLTEERAAQILHDANAALL